MEEDERGPGVCVSSKQATVNHQFLCFSTDSSDWELSFSPAPLPQDLLPLQSFSNIPPNSSSPNWIHPFLCLLDIVGVLFMFEM